MVTRTVTESLVLSLLFATVLAVGLDARAAHANGILVAAPPDAPRAEPAGPGGPVQLRRHDVRARLTDQVAQVTVEQVFANSSARRLEGTYLFPLPEGAAVSEFAMTLGGRMVQGEVIEAERARSIYQSIVRRRRDPGLLEYVGRGLYRARVFPIEPHGELTIRLRYQQVLPEDAGILEWRYPLASDRLNGAPVSHVFVDVEIESRVDLKAVYSPSHDLALTRTGERKARATLETADRRQTKDLLLYVGRSPDAVGFSLLSHKAAAEDGTFMAVLAPSAQISDARRVAKDVVYVLDASGSMAGAKIEQARAALTYGVRMLRPGDRFNILAFSSGTNLFRPQLVWAQPLVADTAAKWIAGLEARGGTYIEKALLDALAMRSKDRLFMVVFITDGRPTIGETDPQALARLVEKANESKARVFTFGVGYDLDVGLLDRIAETTQGTRDYIAPGEDIEIVTGRFFHKVDQPVMTDVKVDLGPGVYDVYPQRMPDLFAGGQVVVFGRYKAGGDRTVVLAGRLAGEDVVHEYGAALRNDGGADFLPRLWAHRKVAFLLDAIRLNGSSQELVDEVVRLATRHAIVTPYTAGLVVEEEELERVHSENPLFRIGGRNPGGIGGSYRPYSGPAGSLPPGLRDPSDPTPPPPPPSGPPTTPPPTTPMPAGPVSTPGGPVSPPLPPSTGPQGKARAKASKDLRKRKEASGELDEAEYRAIKEKIRTVAGKTFVLRRDGRWVDTAWDGKQETVRVEAFTKAWFELQERGSAIPRYLALGQRVVFVFGDVVYEVVPAE